MSHIFRPYPPSAVNIGGEIRNRMELTARKMLFHLDTETVFTRHFKQRREKPEVPGGFSGYGMFLDAVVKASMHGIGGDAMRKFKTKALAELIATQSADGAITVFSNKPGGWDNHEQAYMIQAFVLDHRYFSCEESLNAALKLGKFLIGRKTTVNLGLESAFLMLYQESGNKMFLDYCRDDFKLCESIEDYDHMIPVNGIAHVYTWIARVLAQLQYAQLTGDESPMLFEGMNELYRRIFCGYSSISGSCSGGICWGEVWDNSQVGLGRWGETCVSAYLLRCTAKMFEFNANPRFGDLYERILFNAFFGAQSEDGLRQRYFIPFNEPGEWYEHETYCCPNNLRRMMFELPDAVFFETTDGVAVNLYTNSELSAPNVKIKQETSYPESERVHCSISTSAPFMLTLRIPSWCERAEISDGKTIIHASPGWFKLPVDAGKMELDVRFPMSFRLIRGTMAQTGRAALMHGPLVYAVERERNRLSGHELDLLTIDNTCPFESVAEGIRVSCVVPNMTHERKEILFTRFSNTNRTRTYFPAVSECGIQDDNIFNLSTFENYAKNIKRRTKMENSGNYSKQSFSLIELLVVIAIIALLAGMILPALNMAREKAKAIGCMNKEKQIVFGFISYAGDWKDMMPPGSWDSRNETRWMWMLEPYVKNNFSGKSNIPQSSLWGCPTQRKWIGMNSNISYGYNTMLFGGENYAEQALGWGATHMYPIKLQRITQPSKQCVLADTCAGMDGNDEARSLGYWTLHYPTMFSLRHSRRSNIGYLAGNVEPSDYKGTVHAYLMNYPINASLNNKPTSFYAHVTINYSPYN